MHSALLAHITHAIHNTIKLSAHLYWHLTQWKNINQFYSSYHSQHHYVLCLNSNTKGWGGRGGTSVFFFFLPPMFGTITVISTSRPIVTWADLVLHVNSLRDFTGMWPENLHHFLNLCCGFWWNAFWHRWYVAAQIFCMRPAESDLTVTPSVRCMDWLFP